MWKPFHFTDWFPLKILVFYLNIKWKDVEILALFLYEIICRVIFGKKQFKNACCLQRCRLSSSVGSSISCHTVVLVMRKWHSTILSGPVRTSSETFTRSYRDLKFEVTDMQEVLCFCSLKWPWATSPWKTRLNFLRANHHRVFVAVLLYLL